MRHKLTFHNLESNPKAAYVFIEKDKKYRGKRFYLTKVREEEDVELIKILRRRKSSPDIDEKHGKTSAVIFEINKILPLVGK